MSPPEVGTLLHIIQTPALLMVEKVKSRGVKHRLQVWDDTIWCQYQYQMSVPASSKYTAASLLDTANQGGEMRLRSYNPILRSRRRCVTNKEFYS